MIKQITGLKINCPICESKMYIYKISYIKSVNYSTNLCSCGLSIYKCGSPKEIMLGLKKIGAKIEKEVK